MNRRWRTNATQHLPSLPSYNEFAATLEPLPDDVDAGFTTPADIYSALCALHAKGEAPMVRSNGSAGYHYLLASTSYVKSKGAEEREVVVPMSTAYEGLTPDTLHLLFETAPGQRNHLILALVDSDGTVSTQRLFNLVQPPEESHTGGEASGQEVHPNSTDTRCRSDTPETRSFAAITDLPSDCE